MDAYSSASAVICHGLFLIIFFPLFLNDGRRRRAAVFARGTAFWNGASFFIFARSRVFSLFLFRIHSLPDGVFPRPASPWALSRKHGAAGPSVPPSPAAYAGCTAARCLCKPPSSPSAALVFSLFRQDVMTNYREKKKRRKPEPPEVVLDAQCLRWKPYVATTSPAS